MLGHECEWRRFSLQPAHEEPLPDGAITEVIYGAMISEGDKAVIKDWVQRGGHKVLFFQAAPKGEDYELEIRRIE
jgi:hypothetical protein